MGLSPKAQRKLRRRAENEAYAKDARFWIDKIKSADRIGSNIPVNRQADFGLSKRAVKSLKKIKLYLVKFTLLSDPSITFLKIGVTGRSPNVRFKGDSEKYKIEVICSTLLLNHKNCLALEASLLEFFEDKKYRPPVSLITGNTECLAYSEEIKKSVSDMLAGLVQ